MSHEKYFNPETENWKAEREIQLQIALSKIDDIIFQNKKYRKLTIAEMEAILRKINTISEAYQQPRLKSIADSDFNVDYYELVPKEY